MHPNVIEWTEDLIGMLNDCIASNAYQAWVQLACAWLHLFRQPRTYVKPCPSTSQMNWYTSVNGTHHQVWVHPKMSVNVLEPQTLSFRGFSNLLGYFLWVWYHQLMVPYWLDKVYLSMHVEKGIKITVVHKASKEPRCFRQLCKQKCLWSYRRGNHVSLPWLTRPEPKPQGQITTTHLL